MMTPVGLILLWNAARNPLRGKLIISIIALLSMTLMLTIFLLSRQPNPYAQQQDLPMDYSNLPSMNQTQTTATPAPTDPPVSPGVQSDETQNVIPANPAG